MTFLSKGRPREARQKQDDERTPHGFSLSGLGWDASTFMGVQTHLMLFSSFLFCDVSGLLRQGHTLRTAPCLVLTHPLTFAPPQIPLPQPADLPRLDCLAYGHVWAIARTDRGACHQRRRTHP